MRPCHVPRSLILASALAVSGAPLSAHSDQGPGAANSARAPNDRFARFVPDPDNRDHTIDYRHWDEALGYFVIPMGPSIRDGARRVEPRLGTRISHGQTSRFRLEGNRVAFSYLGDDIRAALSEYRRDLERVGSTLPLARLARNEQLAFWLNLHNVAIFEALAHAYPLRDPSERTFGPEAAALDDARLVTIGGTALSPRDIREKIVYPGWRDPKVIYGFWRGTIGGPSLQRLAFTSDNVDLLLALAAEEFVNSLRGVEAYGGKLRVSALYDEAAPFYFEDDEALRGHLLQYTREEVAALIARHAKTAYAPFETAIADLTLGKGDPALGFVCGGAGGGVGAVPLAIDPAFCTDEASRPDPAIARLMKERAIKLERAQRQGIRAGTVVLGDGAATGERPREVR